MEGNPRHFESIGNRLGFKVVEEKADRLCLVWRGPLFPSLLCLGISLALLFISVPVFQAIRLQGLESRVASLWYFPLMNAALLGVSAFLLSLKREITLDHGSHDAVMSKRSLFRRQQLVVEFEEIAALQSGHDQVYSGLGVAGSTAGESFPANSLRLLLANGESVLIDRGGKRRLEELGERLGRFLDKPLRKSSS